MSSSQSFFFRMEVEGELELLGGVPEAVNDAAYLEKKDGIVEDETISDYSIGNLAASPAYSRFTRNEKIFLMALCTFTGFLSTITDTIYFPILNIVAKRFHVGQELANVTVVVHFIFQGVSPIIMGTLADAYGRRPLIISSLIIYICANIGLARSQTYAQILVLRCLQAIGIAPVVTINNGVIRDITTRKERGKYVGYVSGLQVIGSAVGAIIGAGVETKWHWRAVFWFLSATGGLGLLLVLLILPETNRAIVGNGSVKPKLIFNLSPMLCVPFFQRTVLKDPEPETLEKRTKLTFIAPFLFLFVPEMIVLFFTTSVQYTTWTTHHTILTTILTKKYHYKIIIVGVCYLPAGICTVLGGVIAGFFLSLNYKRRVRQHKEWIARERQDLSEIYEQPGAVLGVLESNERYMFNLFRARLEVSLVTLTLSGFGFIVYGWCLGTKQPIESILIASGWGSFWSKWMLTMTTTLLVDLFPRNASAATSCLDFCRSMASAIITATLQKMEEHMGIGGLFTFLGCLTIFGTLLNAILIKNGRTLCYKWKYLG